MYSKLRQQCGNVYGTARTDNRHFNLIKPDQQTCKPGGSSCKAWTKDPTKWGPHLWAYMHYSAANYPEKPSPEQVHTMKEWLCSLPVTIPCHNCSKHYKQYIEKNKADLEQICSTRDSLFDFLVDIHNKVNVRTGKKTIGYDKARELYYLK